MTDYVEKIIAGVDDPDFQTFVAELCQSVNWSKDEFNDKSLANLFTAIVAADKKLNLDRILICRVLAIKVNEVDSNSVVKNVCCELANRRGLPMDNFARKAVFTLIKQCYRATCPPKPRQQRLTRLQRSYQFNTELIRRRRRNGSL